MTGVQLYNFLVRETDLAFTGYIQAGTEADDWFKKGFIVTLQNIYREQLANQNAFDEINFLISTDAIYPLNNNKIYINQLLIADVTFVGTTITLTTELPHNLIAGDTITTSGILNFTNNPNGTFTVIAPVTANVLTFVATLNPTSGTYTANSGHLISPKIISDYYHYLDFGRARFTQLTSYKVIGSTFATPIKITLDKRTYLRTGDQVFITGIGGNTNANGTFYLRQANETQYFLYTDATLSTPAVGNGTQTGTGVLSQIITSTLKFKRSQEKGWVFGEPSVQNPYFQQSKLLIKILPTNQVCDQLTLDYIIKPPAFANTLNNTIDLSDHYPDFFQYRWISETGKLINLSMRDSAGVGAENEIIIENP